MAKVRNQNWHSLSALPPSIVKCMAHTFLYGAHSKMYGRTFYCGAQRCTGATLHLVPHRGRLRLRRELQTTAHKTPDENRNGSSFWLATLDARCRFDSMSLLERLIEAHKAASVPIEITNEPLTWKGQPLVKSDSRFRFGTASLDEIRIDLQGQASLQRWELSTHHSNWGRAVLRCRAGIP
jgi:hypothetical protein